jgi:hypothetical protein
MQSIYHLSLFTISINAQKKRKSIYKNKHIHLIIIIELAKEYSDYPALCCCPNRQIYQKGEKKTEE